MARFIGVVGAVNAGRIGPKNTPALLAAGVTGGCDVVGGYLACLPAAVTVNSPRSVFLNLLSLPFLAISVMTAA